MNVCMQFLRRCKENFIESSWFVRFEQLSFGCLCLFFFDCSFTGGGHYFSLGSVTPRMMLGLLSAIFALPQLICKRRKHLKNPINCMILIFAIYLLGCAIHGILAQNRLNVLLADIKGFMWLFLIPIMISIVNTSKRLSILCSFILAGAFVQGVFVLAINFVITVFPNGIALLYDWFVKQSLFGTIDNISPTIKRIFMKSSPYMVFGCAIAFLRQIVDKHINKYYICLISVCLCAMLLSFTRSLYGCAFVVITLLILLVFFVKRSHFKRAVKAFVLVGVLAISLTLSQELLLGGSYINFALSRTFGVEPAPSIVVSMRNELLDKIFPSSNNDTGQTENEEELQGEYIDRTQESDKIRKLTQDELLDLFKSSPLFGRGLGASASSREDGLDEYFYLDMLARTGIVGLVLYVIPFVYVCLFCVRNIKKLGKQLDCCAVLCGMFGFWTITWFNPWMNAVLGIACYALCLSIPTVLNNEENDYAIVDKEKEE